MFGITSAKLEVGMTIDKINNSSASENVKKKQIELFNKYNTTPDDKIDEKEFAQYEKDCTKQKWINAGIAIGGTLFAGGLLYLGYKNLSGNNFQEKWQNIKSLITKTKEATQTPVAPHTPSTTPSADVAALAKGAEGPALSASYASKAESLPIQEVRTQSYYDEIMDDIANAGGEKSFFNPRTGNTTKIGLSPVHTIDQLGVPHVSYTGFPDRVTVSRGDMELLKLMESGEGYSRTSRYVADGQNTLTRNNSSRDLLRTSATGKTSWQAQSGQNSWIGAPASRTPVGSKIHVERRTSAGQKVIVANSATPNKVIVTFFDNEAPSRPFKITPEELFEEFGVKI